MFSRKNKQLSRGTKTTRTVDASRDPSYAFKEKLCHEAVSI